MNENEGSPRKCPSCGAPLPPDAPEGLCPRCVAANLAAGTEVKTAELGPGGTILVKPAPEPTPSIEEIAKLFPQLEILETLGRGGMGAVYKARQPRLDRFVALKILAGERKSDPQFAERFEREARTLARLHHPNIVAIHEFGETGGNFYLLMEYVDGLTLRQLLQSRKLSPEEALTIVPKICEALQYAHQQGIVHRDIKPENILLDKAGQVKIADFGIAKLVGQEAQTGLTQEQQVIGTPHYMAPEQVERPKTVDHRADIYSLGVVLYEMLTGELPLGKFAPPSRKVQVDVRLDEVVLHALEKEPERRYQDAQQVKTDVEAIRSEPGRGVQSVAAIPVVPISDGSDKKILPAFLLAFFFGVFGAHRFYVGKIVTGLLQLAAVVWCVFLIVACALNFWPGEPMLGILLGFSVCGCIIMAVIDWILIACRAFTDGQGRKITEWVRSHPSNPPASGSSAPISQSGAAAATTSPGSKIIAPGVAMMVAGFLKLSGAFVGLLFVTGMSFPGLSHLPGFDFGFPHEWSAVAGASLLFTRIVPGFLILLGAFQMVTLRSYAWSLAAAILSLISCSLISFPIGIWALVVLSQTDVRQIFEKNRGQPQNSTSFPWPMATIVVVVGLLAIGLFGVGAYFFSHGFHGLAGGDSDVPALAESVDDSTDVDSDALPLESNQTNQAAFSTSVNGTNSTNRFLRSGASADFTTSFIVAPGGKLTMDVDRGDVHVSGSNRDTVGVRVIRRVTRASASRAAELIKEHRIELRQTGNDVSITARTPPSLDVTSLFGIFGIFTRPNLEVRYEIDVPRKYAIDSQTAGGNVNVSDIQGTVKAHTMGGTVKLAEIDGDADAKTMGGDVTVGKCTGDLRAHTAGGTINIEEFSGPCIHADTMGGNVTSDFATPPGSDCDLRTMGGNVTARLPGSAAFMLDADTLGGSINTELPVQTEGKHRESHLHGAVNGGGPTLRLHTMGGNIDITKR